MKGRLGILALAIIIFCASCARSGLKENDESSTEIVEGNSVMSGGFGNWEIDDTVQEKGNDESLAVLVQGNPIMSLVQENLEAADTEQEPS